MFKSPKQSKNSPNNPNQSKPVLRQPRDSPKQSRDSPETVQRQSKQVQNSPKTIQRQPRDRPKQFRESPENVQNSPKIVDTCPNFLIIWSHWKIWSSATMGCGLFWSTQVKCRCDQGRLRLVLSTNCSSLTHSSNKGDLIIKIATLHNRKKNMLITYKHSAV